MPENGHKQEKGARGGQQSMWTWDRSSRNIAITKKKKKRGSLVLQVNNAHGQNEADSTPVWRASSRVNSSRLIEAYMLANYGSAGIYTSSSCGWFVKGIIDTCRAPRPSGLKRYCRQALQQAQMRENIGDKPCIQVPLMKQEFRAVAMACRPDANVKVLVRLWFGLEVPKSYATPWPCHFLQ